MVNIRVKRSMQEKMGLNPKYPPMELGGEVHQDVNKRWEDGKWRLNWGQVGICLRQTCCAAWPKACQACLKHSGYQPKRVR